MEWACVMRVGKTDRHLMTQQQKTGMRQEGTYATDTLGDAMAAVLTQLGDLEDDFSTHYLLELFKGVELLLAVLLEGGFAGDEEFFGAGRGQRR